MTTAPMDDGREEPSARPRWKRTLLAPLVALVIALLGLIGLVAADWLSADDVYIVSANPLAPTPEPVALSGAQQEIVAELGRPDGFTILFYETVPGQPTRIETWSYYAAEWEISFVDGEITDQEPPDETSGEVIAAPYRPESFSALMSLDNVVAASGIDEYLEVQLEDEVLPGGTVFVGEQLLFGTRNGQLLYIEAVPLTPVEDGES